MRLGPVSLCPHRTDGCTTSNTRADLLTERISFLHPAKDVACCSQKLHNITSLRQSVSHTNSSWLVLGTMFGASMYGGLHLLAWNAPFGASSLRLAWHVSGVLIASSLIAALISWPVVYIYRRLKQTLAPNLQTRRILMLYRRTAKTVGGFALFFYCVARIWLIIGCLVNVAHLSEGVFREPEWSRYIPHGGAG
jgi:hypothetical protein